MAMMGGAHNPSANGFTGQFEGRETDQIIGTTFTFRTHGMNGIWDLATFTNTNQDVPSRPLPDYPTPWDGENPETFVPGDPESIRRRPWNRPPWEWVRNRRPWRPPYNTPQTEHPNYSTDNPGDEIIVWDYSNPSQSDMVTIGTH